MGSDPGLTELRRGVLGPCVLALLAQRPRFGLELVRELDAAGGLLTSDGTVYPLLTRLHNAGLVTSEWRDQEGERARRYYFITDEGRAHLKAFQADWTGFTATVDAVLRRTSATAAPSDQAAAPDSANDDNGKTPGRHGSVSQVHEEGARP
jgi:PadR family transcriptional regulator PadR